LGGRKYICREQEEMPRRTTSPVLDPRKKIISCISSELKRSQSMKGGSALAARSIREFIFEHGRKGGLNTKDLYGVDHYRSIASKRKSRWGWPKGKLRKPQVFTEMALNTIERLGLKPETNKMLEDV
jgi:hypothetical protein